MQLMLVQMLPLMSHCGKKMMIVAVPPTCLLCRSGACPHGRVSSARVSSSNGTLAVLGPTLTFPSILLAIRKNSSVEHELDIVKDLCTPLQLLRLVL